MHYILWVRIKEGFAPVPQIFYSLIKSDNIVITFPRPICNMFCAVLCWVSCPSLKVPVSTLNVCNILMSYIVLHLISVHFMWFPGWFLFSKSCAPLEILVCRYLVVWDFHIQRILDPPFWLWKARQESSDKRKNLFWKEREREGCYESVWLTHRHSLPHSSSRLLS